MLRAGIGRWTMRARCIGLWWLIVGRARRGRDRGASLGDDDTRPVPSDRLDKGGDCDAMQGEARRLSVVSWIELRVEDSRCSDVFALHLDLGRDAILLSTSRMTMTMTVDQTEWLPTPKPTDRQTARSDLSTFLSPL